MTAAILGLAQSSTQDKVVEKNIPWLTPYFVAM
jgi:hypothetical protein